MGGLNKETGRLQDPSHQERKGKRNFLDDEKNSLLNPKLWNKSTE